MKKILLLALIASSAVFANATTDIAENAAATEAKPAVIVVDTESEANASEDSKEAPAEKPAM